MKKYTISNSYQKISILNYGATIYEWLAFKDKRNIVITNKYLEDYLNSNNGYLSGTIGRVANRINKGVFTLNDKEYRLDTSFDGTHHGHGGIDGFHKKKFEVFRHTNEKLILHYHSEDLESGYPGNLNLFVTYELKDNQLYLSYDAKSDADTIINITNHSYFNLSKENDVLNHSLSASSNKTVDTDVDLIPTGEITSHKNKVLNLTNTQLLSEIVSENTVYEKAKGLDHYFLFNKKHEINLKYKSKQLKIETSYPGAQIYTFQHPVKQELLNRSWKPYLGVAIECQYEPDAINHSNFNSIILKKDDSYSEQIIYTIIE